MAEITAETSLQELAAIISQALEAQGLMATLSGGAAVSIDTNNLYQSHDLDFVSTAATANLARAVATLGFVPTPAQRLFSHPATASAFVSAAVSRIAGMPKRERWLMNPATSI